MNILLVCFLGTALAANIGDNCTTSTGCDNTYICDSSGLCTWCFNTSECQEISSFLACNSNICNHKSLLPLQWQDILLFILLFIADFLNAGSGSVVPLLIYLGGFTTQESIALVNVLITGNAITNYLLNLKNQDPTTIQYDVSMAIQPMSIIGTIVGVIFNSVFPDWLTLTLLTLGLIGMIIYTFKNGISAYNSETSPQESSSPPVQDIISWEETIPWFQIVILFLILAMVCGIFILKGGSGGTSLIGVSACGIAWWTLSVIPIVLLILITMSIAAYLIKTDYDKWTSKKLLTVKSLGLGAGITTSTIGIDNGIIMDFLLGETSTSSQSTASFSLIFTSISSIVQFAINGTLDWTYALVLGIVGIAATFLGQIVTNWVTTTYNKKSYLILSGGILIVLSTIVLIIMGSITLANDIKNGQSLSFNSLCG